MKKDTKLFPAVFLCLLVFIFASTAAFATDYYWDVTSGDWSTGANWDPVGPPTSAADNVYIYNGGTANIDADISILYEIDFDSGVINQSAYSVNVDTIVIGDTSNMAAEDHIATYNFSGGTLIANEIRTLAATYLFQRTHESYVNITGGNVQTGSLISAGNGSINISDGYVQTDKLISWYGSINISGGTIDVEDEIWVGYMEENPAGTMSGTITQSGGDIVVNGSMYMSRCYEPGSFNPPVSYPDSQGRYYMSGGSLTILGDMTIGDHFSAFYDPFNYNSYAPGELHITGGQITIGGDLIIEQGDHSYINDYDETLGNTGSALDIWGDYNNKSQASSDFDLRHTLVTLYSGEDWDNAPTIFSYTQDKGAVFAGLDDNFAIGNLVFAGNESSSVCYRLEADVYCYGLAIYEGVTIDLNGYNIYYVPMSSDPYNGVAPETFLLEGVLVGGNAIPITGIPEPATIAMIAAGALGLAATLRRRFK